MQAQLVKVAPFQMIGISIRTTNQGGKAAKDIPALWQQFMQEQVFQKIPNKLEDKVYVAYTDYEGDHNAPYTMVIGCKVDSLEELPEGMAAFNFKGGDFDQYYRKGKLNEIVIDQWMKIWTSDIARAYDADFEVYDSTSQDPENSEVRILVGLQS